MGNKTSLIEKRTVTLYSASTPRGVPVAAYLSEEDYVPMTPAMRKKLLAGKRFQHVARTSLAARGDGGDANKDEVSKEDKNYEIKKKNSLVLEDKRHCGSGKKSSVVEVDKMAKKVANQEEKDGELEKQEVNERVKEEPSKGSQSKSASVLGSKGDEQKHLYFMKSPTLTNRRYSLMDMKLNETKSRFTMKLKDKLRQSKLELGFDDEFFNWKEFVYKDNPEGGRRSVERRVGHRGSDEKLHGDKFALIDPKPVEVMDYCAHNCQVLGLCGVKRPQADLFPCQSPYDAKGRFEKSHMKDNCNCDVCTLSYLTSMGFPDHGEEAEMAMPVERYLPLEEAAPKPAQWLKKTGSDNVSILYGKGDGSVQETIRVVDMDQPNKTVEVKIYSERSNQSVNNTVLESSPRSTSTRTTFEEDSTNLKIRRLFQQYGGAQARPKSPTVESRRRPNPYDDVSIANMSSDQDYLQTPRTRGNRPLSKKRTDPPVARKGRKESSSSIFSPSASSSLSTIMSYKRVKQIFQSIVEKNRPRKRGRKNIHKYLEMEELGLGEVRGNRWYPSDSKTKAIWEDIAHAKGVEARFRKCHGHRPSRPEVR